MPLPRIRSIVAGGVLALTASAALTTATTGTADASGSLTVTPACTAEKNAVVSARAILATKRDAYVEAIAAVTSAQAAVPDKLQAYRDAITAVATAQDLVAPKRTAYQEAIAAAADALAAYNADKSPTNALTYQNAVTERADARTAYQAATGAVTDAVTTRTTARSGYLAAAAAVTDAVAVRATDRVENNAAAQVVADAVAARTACLNPPPAPPVVANPIIYNDDAHRYWVLYGFQILNLQPGQTVVVDAYKRFDDGNYQTGSPNVQGTADENGIASISLGSHTQGLCGAISAADVYVYDTDRTQLLLGPVTINAC